MWEALRDWDHLRAKLREDLAPTARRPRPPPGIRAAVWVLLAVGWAATGWPYLAIPAVMVFEAFVVPGLAARPRRSLGPLRRWECPESFVVSPESVPGHPAER
jgi:hypothetical protein